MFTYHVLFTIYHILYTIYKLYTTSHVRILLFLWSLGHLSTRIRLKHGALDLVDSMVFEGSIELGRSLWPSGRDTIHVSYCQKILVSPIQGCYVRILLGALNVIPR